MAIVKEYTTEAKVENFLGIQIDTGKADDAINGAVDVIDQLTGRNFKVGNAEERFFDGNGKSELMIDECVEIEKVEKSSDQWGDIFEEVSDEGLSRYIPLPNNYQSKKVPIYMLLLRSDYFLCGKQNVKITAKWGFSAEVPPAISQAATVLAAGLYMYNLGGASGSVQSEKIGNYAVTYGSADQWKSYRDALTLLQGYRKFRL